jgi:stage V sporulation protein K
MPPTTRQASTPKSKQITFVFNIDEVENKEDLPTPKSKSIPKPAKPLKKRSKKKLVIPMYDGPLETLSDLIGLAEAEILYDNIDVSRLLVIKEELKELNALIGLDDIKKTIFEQLIFYMQHLHEGSDMYLNTVIYGPPGTGKTTVAKLIGRMFSKLRVLTIPDGYEYEYDEDEENVIDIFEIARRDDFVGQYLGSTALKTQHYLEMCLGGVVFIDEVYSLGNKDGTDSFAKEAIDTINLFLSEHRDHFMLIVAGYKEEIDSCFFKYNEGLRRRFMWYHTIEPYSPEQLRDIFLSKLVQSEWTYDENVPETMLHVIQNHKELFVDNAGSIENFITLLKIKHGKRVILLPSAYKKRITPKDLDMTVKTLEKEKKPKEFMTMYM